MYRRFPSYKTTEIKIQSTLHIPAPYDLNYRHLDDHIATSLRNICENPLKERKHLMHIFNVILLSDVI